MKWNESKPDSGNAKSEYLVKCRKRITLRKVGKCYSPGKPTLGAQ